MSVLALERVHLKLENKIYSELVCNPAVTLHEAVKLTTVNIVSTYRNCSLSLPQAGNQPSFLLFEVEFVNCRPQRPLKDVTSQSTHQELSEDMLAVCRRSVFRPSDRRRCIGPTEREPKLV